MKRAIVTFAVVFVVALAVLTVFSVDFDGGYAP